MRAGLGVFVVPAPLAACLVFIAMSSSAQAAVDPVIEENIESAAQFYASESGAADLPCDTACQALKVDLRRAPTALKDPVPSRLIKSFVDGPGSIVNSP